MAAATFGPALRQKLEPRVIYALACLVIAAAAAVLAVTHSVVLVVVALVAAGAFWIMGLGLLGAAYQGQLPDWVKARGVSYYLLAFQGANGIGSLCIGAVAQVTTVPTAFLVVAGGLAAVTLATWRVGLPKAEGLDHLLAEPLPLPPFDGAVEDGPVLVTVEYELAAGNADEFLERGGDLRRMRRRTGAVHWHLQRDVAEADHFTETFVVGSWEEHERQHARLERQDLDLLDHLDSLSQPGRARTVRHAVGVEALT
jgi:Transmembrane secretion effector